MLDTLFGLIPAESRGQQWAARDLQLVNWGGYDGRHTVRFSPTATLLTGGSGSGKSTLMDAYIALMMPHTTPFNGASNGGVQGRPRGADQRNILSYGRGKLDETLTAGGPKVNVLRGDGVDTWTALAMTWSDASTGALFTAVRAWYIPAAARVLDDTVRVRGTVDGPFDLRELEAAAKVRFTDSSIRAAGIDTISTDREFTARLHTTLGIGAAGAGNKAISLLARIQSGQQITTVDELYKRMVLEEPETLAAADAVVTHFDELEGTRQRMLTARSQVRALEPIHGLRDRIAAASNRLQLIDRVGGFSQPDSQAALWRADRRLGLLRDVEAQLRDEQRSADATVREQQALVDAAEAEADGLVQVLRSSGGDRLESAQRELKDVERRAVEVQEARERLDRTLDAVGMKVSSAAEFARLQEEAGRALADDDARHDARRGYATAASAVEDAKRKVSELSVEQRTAGRRKSNISASLLESRDVVAQAAGLTAEDLPFVGELVEVLTEYEPWRQAFNLALGGFATTLLIDESRVSDFRTAIDSVRVPVRLRYEGVATGHRGTRPADARTLPGRLDYRPTPFTGWLMERLEDRFGYVCVDTPADLSHHRMALTINGQMSQGSRGAHGGQGRSNVLGFDGTRRVAELDGELSAAQTALVESERALATAETALDQTDARHAAYRALSETTWERVDVTGIESERDRWLNVMEEVTAGNPEIARLQSQISTTRQKAVRFREEIGRAKHAAERVETRWGHIADQVDAEQEIIEAAADAARTLEPGTESYLDERFDLAAEAPTDRSDDTDTPDADTSTPAEVLERFDAALTQASSRLAADRARAQDGLEQATGDLRRTLEGFLERWPNPNLTPDPDTALGDFERILDELQASGLADLEREWRDSLLTLSGNDLTSLDSALSRALREIRERIEPINAIMAELPFYDDDHRLRITIRESQSVSRRRFRAQLREVRTMIDALSEPAGAQANVSPRADENESADEAATEAAAEAANEQVRERAYAAMAAVIDRIRRDSPEFTDLIDVRGHVHVAAERIRAATGEHVALYDHIGEKSGGESQELIAFIVGAALRYQLGDAGAPKPRYAPVFLDEALIKADAHFTKRAIGAWRGLGFQLVIGAPNDKYSAIEPHVDVEYDILKDTSGRSWPKAKVALPEASRVAKA